MSMLFKRIKDWATSITAFRTGDMIPVDGPSGTAKMSKDDLLKETAENALDKSFNAFDSTENYTAGQVFIYEDAIKLFTRNHSAGSYSASDNIPITIDNLISIRSSDALHFLKGYIWYGFSMEAGKQIDPWGFIVENSSFSVSDYVSIFPDKKYVLHTKGYMYGNQTPIVFYDKNKNKISYYSDQSNTRIIEFTSPSNAYYVRFSSDDLNSTAISDYYLELIDSITLIDSSSVLQCLPVDYVGNIRTPSNFIKGYYLDAWGNPTINNKFDISQFIEVESECSYEIDFGKNCMFSNSQAISFYDNELVRLSTIRSSTTVTKIIIDTPQKCKYIQYSRWNDKPITDTIKKISGNSIWLDTSLDNLNVIPYSNVFFIAENPVVFYTEALIDNTFRDSIFVKCSYSGSNKFDRRNSVILDSDSAICRFGIFDDRNHYSNKCFYLNARKVSKDAKSGNTINMLMIGDSLSDYARINTPLSSLFAEDLATLNIIGTRIYNGIKYEGRSGWSSYDYCHTESYNTYTNPFLNNGVFDIPYYLQENSLATPDVFVIELGTNDTWRPMLNTTTTSNINEMITSMLQANNNCKIIILTPCCQYKGVDDLTQTAISGHQMFNKMYEIYESFGNRESENIYVCNMGGTYDPIYSFNRVQVPVNSTEYVYKCTDNTHPTSLGYSQFATSLYAALKYV